MSERKIESGPGFVRAKECPDCGHTRCGEGCVCNCDAARAEYEAAALRHERDEHARIRSEQAEIIKALADALRNLRAVAASQGVSELHEVILNADDALRLAGRL